MSTETAPSSASQVYERAHAIHYEERDLLRALGAYCRIIASFPSAREAKHSRAQIRNIVNLAVPADELLSAQTELALRHLQRSAERGGQEGNQLEDRIEAEPRIPHDHARAKKSASLKKNAAARRTRTWARRRIRLLDRNGQGAAR